jgi:hypothetical protein
MLLVNWVHCRSAKNEVIDAAARRLVIYGWICLAYRMLLRKSQ